MQLEEMIPKLSERLLQLSSGDLAELRRIDLDGPGPAAYWRLAAECGFLQSGADVWMQIVRILALLTPKGDRRKQDRLHDGKRGLGQLLCDGGAADWPGAGGPRPVLSERRLARLLVAPFEQHADALTRIAHMLAASRSRENGVNCIDIAVLLLSRDPSPSLQKIARDYYRRLDSAAHHSEHEEIVQ